MANEGDYMTDDEYKAMTESGAKAWAGVTAAEIAELRDGGIAELEHENRLLRARNERLEAELLLVQQATAAECAELITTRHFTEHPESDKDAEDMRVALDCADAIRARFAA